MGKRFEHVTAQNLPAVLKRFAAWVEAEDVDSREDVATRVEGLLEGLYRDDAFGTEGQCDPRGDRRNKE